MMLKNKRLFGACGINRATCNIYQAYTRKDVELQRKISKEFFGDAMHTINCDGCGERLDIHWSQGCKMMQFAHERGLLVCSKCPEFPCPDIEAFYSRSARYEKAKQNALRQREIGLEEWWRDQQELK